MAREVLFSGRREPHGSDCLRGSLPSGDRPPDSGYRRSSSCRTGGRPRGAPEIPPRRDRPSGLRSSLQIAAHVAQGDSVRAGLGRTVRRRRGRRGASRGRACIVRHGGGREHLPARRVGRTRARRRGSRRLGDGARRDTAPLRAARGYARRSGRGRDGADSSGAGGARADVRRGKALLASSDVGRPS